MKRIVSISLGSSSRDHATETTLLGTPIRLERIGTDGDQARFRASLERLDGEVDAFGVGGTDLGVHVAERYYPLHSMAKLFGGIRTPLVDGGGVRRLVERRIAQRVARLVPFPEPRRVLMCSAVARYDMALSFRDLGFEARYADLAFGLGLPVALRSLAAVRWLAKLLMPIVGRLPFEMIYPTGDRQHQIQPKYGRWYEWATVLADDFHYIKQHLPDRLDGKIIVTNTTTDDDVALLRERGAEWLCTSTPRLQGRSFGTNVIEAALTAIAGRGRALNQHELADLVSPDDLAPEVVRLQGAT